MDVINTNINIFDNTSIIYDIYNIKSYQGISESHKRTENNQIRDLRGDNMETDKGVQEKDLRYRDKEWLEDQYINQEKTAIQISEICKCNNSTIGNWLKIFNIKIRSQSNIMKNKFKQGYKQWNEGKKLSKEHRQKISKNGRSKNWKNNYRTDLINPRYYTSFRTAKHRLIIEKEIGRQLWDFERVHHIDEDKQNNHIENLFICKSQSYHSKIHRQLEKIGIELYRSNRFGKIKFNKEKGKYYIIYQNGEVKE